MLNFFFTNNKLSNCCSLFSSASAMLPVLPVHRQPLLQCFHFHYFHYRTYDKPVVDKERLTWQVDNLRLSVLFKLKGKSRSNAILGFDDDCFRLLFYGKGKKGREKGCTLLDRDDFNHVIYRKTGIGLLTAREME